MDSDLGGGEIAGGDGNALGGSGKAGADVVEFVAIVDRAVNLGSLGPIDEAQILDAIQASLRALVVAAPWPRALAAVATDVLSEPARVLGGRLTPWALLPLCCCAAACGDWRRALPASAAAELYAEIGSAPDEEYARLRLGRATARTS